MDDIKKIIDVLCRIETEGNCENYRSELIDIVIDNIGELCGDLDQVIAGWELDYNEYPHRAVDIASWMDELGMNDDYADTFGEKYDKAEKELRSFIETIKTDDLHTVIMLNVLQQIT